MRNLIIFFFVFLTLPCVALVQEAVPAAVTPKPTIADVIGSTRGLVDDLMRQKNYSEAVECAGLLDSLHKKAGLQPHATRQVLMGILRDRISELLLPVATYSLGMAIIAALSYGAYQFMAAPKKAKNS